MSRVLAQCWADCPVPRTGISVIPANAHENKRITVCSLSTASCMCAGCWAGFTGTQTDGWMNHHRVVG